MCVQQVANPRLQQMAWNQAPSNPTSKPDSDSVADCGKAELLKLTPKIPKTQSGLEVLRAGYHS